MRPPGILPPAHSPSLSLSQRCNKICMVVVGVAASNPRVQYVIFLEEKGPTDLAPPAKEEEAEEDKTAAT